MSSTAIIPEIAVPVDSPKSIHAARVLLGLKPQDTKKTIKRKCKRLLAANHPDRGGNPSRNQAFSAALVLVLKNMPAPIASTPRGRPSKHFKPPVKGNYYVVNENVAARVRRGGKTITVTVTELVKGWNGHEDMGYKTREEAEAKIDELRYLSQNDKPRESSTQIQLVPKLKKLRPAKYAIAGPAERAKKHRKSKKAEAAAKEKFRLETIAEIVSHRNDYSDRYADGKDATHTSRCVSGGRDGNKLEHINAAHEASKGGPTATARRSRGNGFRSYNMIGNGPDAFDALDESADRADSDSSLSSGIPDNVSWLEFSYLPDATEHSINAIMHANPGAKKLEVLEYLNALNITGPSAAEALEGESAEDRELLPVDGWDQHKTEYTREDYTKAEKFDETAGTDDESEPLEHIETERLTLYTGQDEFSEFPEREEDDFSEILELCYPAPVAEEEPELPAVKEPPKLPPTPAQPAPDLDNSNENQLLPPAELLQS